MAKKIIMQILFVVVFLAAAVVLLGNSREGFSASSKSGIGETSIGMFAYLNPYPKSNKWSKDTIEKFTEVYNESSGIKDELTEATVKAISKTWALEEEAIYYIKNKKWPINSYVASFMHSGSKIVEYLNKNGNEPSVLGTKVTLKNMARLYPCRKIYEIFISYSEANLQPLSYQHYMGAIDEDDEADDEGEGEDEDEDEDEEDDEDEDDKRKKKSKKSRDDDDKKKKKNSSGMGF